METADLGPCDHIMVGSKIWPALLQNSLSLLLGPEPDGLPCLPCECNLKGTLTLTFTAWARPG